MDFRGWESPYCLQLITLDSSLQVFTGENTDNNDIKKPFEPLKRQIVPAYFSGNAVLGTQSCFFYTYLITQIVVSQQTHRQQ